MQIEIQGTRLGYTVEGQGPPVVLIHGFPLNHRMWQPQVAALRDRFTVITPDLRGFGASGPPAEQTTMDTYADDVLRLLDALGYRRVILGGLSMGGYVVFRILARDAARVGALVLADTRAEPDSEEGRQRRYATIARIQAEGAEGFLSDFIGTLVGPTTKAQRPDVLAAVREIVGGPPPQSLAAALGAMATRPDSRPLLASVDSPAVVLVGEEDTLTPPSAAEAIAAGLRRSRMVTIPAAAHLANLEAPEQFNRALREFLTAEAGSAS
ncbi:MAG: alpha/beta fold hydrolase [Armatimonadetes bacterium]|nr:alpha/beta fold hydrolase [Armatimonadota bacterium]